MGHICRLFKESPRWLISQGKMKKGRVLVELMAKTNNKNPPEQIVALTETPTKVNIAVLLTHKLRGSTLDVRI